MNLPEKIKVARQKEVGGKLFIEEVPMPKPGKGEVLIKVAASPINPSDLSFLNGTYLTQKKYPVVPGLEGSGLVVEAGEGFFPKLRKGKRVMFTASDEHDGAWAEYVVTSAMKCIPVSNHVSFEQAATLIVNPLTALALINIAKAGGHKALVNNAAASALGKMILRLAHRENIEVINIVRKKEQADLLETLGAKHVLNSEAVDFKPKLKEISHQLHANLLLDAVGGKQTSILLEASPKGSKQISYAKLSEEDFCLDPRILIKEEKTMEGFQLANWTAKRKIWQVLSDIKKVKKMVADVFQTEIQDTFPLNEINEAIETYKNNMTKGKVLVVSEE
jgi:NADPH2:quinone reductase